MQFPVNTDGIDPETGEAKQKLVPIYPTHFRNSKSQALCEVEDPTIWIEKDGKNEEVEGE
jgi:hypothetical protein